MTPTNAVGYCRISDARSNGAATTTGVDDQARRLREHAQRIGWHLAVVVVENDTSAFKRRRITVPGRDRPEYRVIRPKWRLVLDALWSGRRDGLLALDLDRVARDPRDLEDLIEVCEHRGLPAESVRGTLSLGPGRDPTAARVLVAVARKSSQDTAARVSEARERQALAGQYGGGKRPYGFEADGTTRIEAECKVIAETAYAILRGATLRGLARDLRDRQVPTVTGNAAWSAQTLRDVLIRPRNAGRMVWRGETVATAPWEQIVPPDVHDRVVTLLTDGKRDTRAGTAPRWLGSGLFRCGICGATVEISIGGRAPRYRCKAKPHLTRAQAPVDELVVGVVLGWIARDYPGVFAPARTEIDAAALRDEQAAIAENLEAMAADAVLDTTGLARRQLRAANQRAGVRLAQIEAELAAADGPDPDLAELAAASDPHKVWAGLPLERQRMVVATTVVVTLLPTGRTGRGFNPAAVRIEPAAA